MGKLRVGVIGAGNMGGLYIQVYRADARTHVAAVCDQNAERVRNVAEKYGIPSHYLDPVDMLAKENLDLVCVATPDFAHFAPAKAALEAGAHVLCEKPFTTDLAEADELCRIVQQTGRKLQVAYSHRWLSVYYRTHLAVKNGELGEPIAGYARKNDTLWVATDLIGWAAKSTPSLFLSGHDIDLMRWWFGCEAVEAHGYGIKKILIEQGIDTYDHIQAQVKFANGGYATFEACWCYQNSYPTVPDSYMQLIGTKGHVNLDRNEESMCLTTEQKFTYPKTFLYGDIFGKVGGAFQGCLSSFIDAILEDFEPHVTAHDGRQVTAVLCAIDKAVRTGRTVPVE